MRQVFVSIFFLLPLFFLGCSGCETSPKPSPPTAVLDIDQLQKRVVVLVDVSSSFSEESAKISARYVAQIMTDMCDGSELLVFAADDKTYDAPIFKVQKKKPLDLVDAKTWENKIWKAQIKASGNAVFQAWQRKLDKSCLLKGLKSVCNALNGSSPVKEIYLLILSDMLECCELGCPHSPDDFTTMEKKLAASNLKDHPLSARVPLENFQIGIINKDATAENSTLMDSKAFESFWKKAFQEMGYPESPLKSQNIDGFLKKII